MDVVKGGTLQNSRGRNVEGNSIGPPGLNRKSSASVIAFHGSDFEINSLLMWALTIPS